MAGLADLPAYQRLKATGLTQLTRKRASLKQKADALQVSCLHFIDVEAAAFHRFSQSASSAFNIQTQWVGLTW